MKDHAYPIKNVHHKQCIASSEHNWWCHTL